MKSEDITKICVFGLLAVIWIIGGVTTIALHDSGLLLIPAGVTLGGYFFYTLG